MNGRTLTCTYETMSKQNRRPDAISDGPFAPETSAIEKLDTPQALRDGATGLEGPTPLVPKLAWKGHLTMLAGREKRGKSTLVGAAVAAATTGSPLFDRASGPFRTLYMSFEETDAQLISRLDLFGIEGDHLRICHRPGGDRLNHLSRLVGQTEPSLIVIDSLTKLVSGSGLDPNRDAVKWDRFVDEVASITRDAGAGTLMTHHANRRSGSYRGSSAIGACVDAIVEMYDRGPETERQLEMKGRSLLPLEDFSYRFDPTADFPFPELA